jgi:hypothetical protein
MKQGRQHDGIFWLKPFFEVVTKHTQYIQFVDNHCKFHTLSKHVIHQSNLQTD